jgi:predicted ArsR family transcriptional regulator
VLTRIPGAGLYGWPPLGALVSSAPLPRPGRGRPRIVYRAERAGEPGTRDEYRLLATVLSDTLASQPDGAAACESAGREWGRYLVPRRLPLTRARDDEARAAVTALLADQGFAPEAAGATVRIRRCPFHDLAESRPEIVCAVHKGVIDGALEELGSELRLQRLDILTEPGVCVATLTRRPSGPSTRAASASPA